MQLAIGVLCGGREPAELNELQFVQRAITPPRDNETHFGA
jgi:hypothetical protein